MFTGNLRTQDFGGPYNLSLLNVQEAEVKSKFSGLLALCWTVLQFECTADQYNALQLNSTALSNTQGDQ